MAGAYSKPSNRTVQQMDGDAFCGKRRWGHLHFGPSAGEFRNLGRREALHFNGTSSEGCSLRGALAHALCM